MENSWRKANAGRSGSDGFVRFIIAVILIITCWSKQAAGQSSNLVAELADGTKYIKGQLLVRYTDDTVPSKREDILRTYNMRIERNLSPLNWQLLSFSDLDRTIEFKEILSKREEIDRVCLDEVFSLSGDPYRNDQWYLETTRMIQAWNYSVGRTVEQVWVAILDSGIPYDDVAQQFTHVDLDSTDTSRAIRLNKYGSERYLGEALYDGEPYDDLSGHGTAVAGIVAATTNNSIGISGAVWNCGLHITKMANENDYLCLSGGAQAIVDVIGESRDIDGKWILNLSWGVKPDSAGVIADAVQEALADSILVVAATGNTGPDAGVSYPAALYGVQGYENVIAVGASSRDDTVPYWSSSDATSYRVTCVAPGGDSDLMEHDEDDIYSTWPDDDYEYVNGTSFSTPQVAVLAALVWGIAPDLTYAEVVEAIEDGAHDIGSSGRDYRSGYGRIDAEATLTGLPIWDWVEVVDWNCGSDWNDNVEDLYRLVGSDNEEYYGHGTEYTFGKGPGIDFYGPELIYHVPFADDWRYSLKIRLTYFNPNGDEILEKLNRVSDPIVLAPPGNQDLQQSLMGVARYMGSSTDSWQIHGAQAVHLEPSYLTYYLNGDVTAEGVWADTLSLEWEYEMGIAEGYEWIWSIVSRIQVWEKNPLSVPGGGQSRSTSVSNDLRWNPGSLMDSTGTKKGLVTLSEVKGYPNPFNPSTTISFRLTVPSPAQVVIYNNRGQFVRTLFSGDLQTGEHTFVWNGKTNSGTAAGTGIYLAVVIAGGNRSTVKLMLIR